MSTARASRAAPKRSARHRGCALLLFASLLAGLAATDAARAHARSESFSRWTVQGRELVATITVPAREITRLEQGATAEAAAVALATAVGRDVQAATPSGRCVELAPPRALAGAPEFARVEWRLRCAGDPQTGLRLRVSLLAREAPSHVHFARMSFPGGGVERVFTWAAPEYEIRPPDGARLAVVDVIGRFFVLGIDHVATGWDHLAFLVALVLVATGVRELAWLVTGFTVGHAAALALATLGAVRPEHALVEALIGFTIAITAARAFVRGAAPGLGLGVAVALGGLAMAALATGAMRPALAGIGLAAFGAGVLAREPGATSAPAAAAITIAFGILHGLGFAAALAVLELPRASLAWSLAAFNVGVEAAQLAVVLVLWATLAQLGPRLAARYSRGSAVIEKIRGTTALALCAVGAFWFVHRWLGA